MEDRATYLLPGWRGITILSSQDVALVFTLSRIGTYFGSAHAGQTAEGDNSVLMQKVAI